MMRVAGAPMRIPPREPDSAQPSIPSSPIMKKKMARRMWPAIMLPKRRRDSDSGRAQWLMISMTNISGLSRVGTGPAKCLRYGMTPCFRAPIQ